MKLKTWQDVDEAVKEIGLLQIRRDRIEGAMNVAIAKIKDEGAGGIAPLDGQIEHLTVALHAFCDDHRSEMEQAKKDAGLTKRGAFGKVAFRKCPPAIKLLKKVEKVVAALQARKLTACLRLVEELNLEALHALPDAVLAEVGARRQPSEKFQVKPDYKTIPMEETARSSRPIRA